MTTQKLLTVTIAILSIFVSGCTKDRPANSDVERLYGIWNWVQSSGGFAGVTTTPATAGYTKTLEFNNDGSYKWFKNGTLQGETKFTLTEGSSIFTSGTAHLIKYHNDFITQSVTFGEQDTLFLSDECYDCFGHTYTRQ